MTVRVLDSGSLAQQIAARGSKRGVDLLVGQAGLDDTGTLVVNINGVNQAGLSLPNQPLADGDTVLVARQGTRYFVLGIVQTANRPSTGTVAGVPANSSTIVVSCTLGSVAMGWVAAYTPTVGDSVWIAWYGSTPVVTGKHGVTGAPPPPAPDTPPAAPKARPKPPPTVTTGTTTFTASGSGTYRAGSWLGGSVTGGNVMQGDFGFGMNDGAWFYGGRIRSSLKGAVVTAAQIWLGRTQGGAFAAQTVHLARVTQDNRPAGPLSFDTGHATDSISLAVGQTGWFTLPASIAQALVDLGGSLGVQPAAPYLRLLGVPNRGSAGAVRITWRRTS